MRQDGSSAPFLEKAEGVSGSQAGLHHQLLGRDGRSPAVAHPFAERVIRFMERDGRFVGLLRHGSSATGRADAHSDLDFTCVVREGCLPEVVADMEAIASAIGELKLCTPIRFIHGERSIFCLYGADLQRVEFTFKYPSGLADLAEAPIVDWDASDGDIEDGLGDARHGWQPLMPDDMEARFWMCVEQATRRLARGELFEVLEILGGLRRVFLGPMLFRRAGLPPHGTRRLEILLPQAAQDLRRTVCLAEPGACARSLAEAISMYEGLRADDPPAAPLDEISHIIKLRLESLS